MSAYLPDWLYACLRACAPHRKALQRSTPQSHEGPSGARARPSQALVGLECDPPGQQCLSECLGVSRRRSACLGGARTRRGMRRPAGHSRQSQQPLNRASRRVPGAQDTTAPGAWPPRAALRVSVPARLTLALPAPQLSPPVLSDASAFGHARMPAHEQAAVRQVQVRERKQREEGAEVERRVRGSFCLFPRAHARGRPCSRPGGCLDVQACGQTAVQAPRRGDHQTPGTFHHDLHSTHHPTLMPLNHVQTHADTLPSGQAGS